MKTKEKEFKDESKTLKLIIEGALLDEVKAYADREGYGFAELHHVCRMLIADQLNLDYSIFNKK